MHATHIFILTQTWGPVNSDIGPSPEPGCTRPSNNIAVYTEKRKLHSFRIIVALSFCQKYIALKRKSVWQKKPRSGKPRRQSGFAAKLVDLIALLTVIIIEFKHTIGMTEPQTRCSLCFVLFCFYHLSSQSRLIKLKITTGTMRMPTIIV